jgi:DNA-binding SARP family transcriptional activator
MGLHIRLLGAVEIEVDGVPAGLPPGRRLRALAGWLALHPGPHPRARLAARLWPDVPDACARASLRSAVWELRRALGPRGAAFVVSDRDSVGFRGAGLHVDVTQFQRLAASGRLAEAVGLCQGELLCQLDDDWVFEAREQHAHRLAGVLGRLARQAASDGRPGAAVAWSGRRVALCPLDEAAGRDLIRRLADSGDLPGALVAYDRLRRRLRDELGLGPARATRRLAGRLREQRPVAGTGMASSTGRHAGQAAGPREAPPAAPAPGVAVTGRGGRLAGRRGEVAALTAAWRASQSGTGRAVVLTGEGGIGKTSLAGNLLAQASRQRAATVTASAGAAHPFGLWSEVLSGVLAVCGGPPPDTCWAGDLAALHPAFGPPPPASLLGSQRGRLFEAVVALIGWACRHHPLALALDDLHLADAASLDLLGYAGRRVAGMRVLFILGQRQLPPRAELESVLVVLRAQGVMDAELALPGLPAATVRRLAWRTARLSAGDADRVAAVAGGNPRLAVAAAQALRHGDFPAGLGGAIAAATRGLRPAARRFLELAALAGRDLRPPDLAALPLPDPAAAATEALGCGLLRPAGDGVGYRHPLLRDAVSGQIPGPQRGRLRALLGTALATPPG